MPLPHRVRSGSRAGFTLIEALVSIVTLSMVMGAVITLISQGMIQSRRTYWNTIARAAALRELERLKTQTWATIAGLPASSPITQPDGNANGVWDTAEIIPGIAGNVYVTDYDADGNGVADPTAKLVTVSVSVYGTMSQLQGLSRLSTVMVQNGLSP